MHGLTDHVLIPACVIVALALLVGRCWHLHSTVNHSLQHGTFGLI